MLTSSGFEVHDLGLDVPVEDIISKAQEVDANIIACSALLTTSMPVMRDMIELLDAMGELMRFKVILGGASITEEFSKSICADETSPNAMQVFHLAKQLMREK